MNNKKFIQELINTSLSYLTKEELLELVNTALLAKGYTLDNTAQTMVISDNFKEKLQKEVNSKLKEQGEILKKKIQEKHRVSLELAARDIKSTYDSKLNSAIQSIKSDYDSKLNTVTDLFKEEISDLKNASSKMRLKKEMQKKEFLTIYNKYNYEKFDGDFEKNILFDLFNAKIKTNHLYNKDFLIGFLHDLINEYEDSMEGMNPKKVLYYRLAIIALQGPLFKGDTKMKKEWCMDEFFYAFLDMYNKVESTLDSRIDEYPLELISKLALDIIPSQSAVESINYKVCLESLNLSISEHLGYKLDFKLLLDLLELVGFDCKATKLGYRANITANIRLDNEKPLKYNGICMMKSKSNNSDFFSSQQVSFNDDLMT